MTPYILIVRSRHDQSGKVVKKLLIEHVEKTEYDANGEVEKADLCVRYRVIGAALSAGRNLTYKFSACYDGRRGKSGCIRLTGSSNTGRAIYLDPCDLRGNRVGSFMMNEIVNWARNWPDAQIERIHLSVNQASEDNKDRRNKFYEQFGIQFNYTDTTKAEGYSCVMQARSLNPWTKIPANLSVRSLGEFLDEQEKCLSTLNSTVDNNQKRIANYSSKLEDANNHPICFAVTTICSKHCVLILLIIVLVGIIIFKWENILKIFHYIQRYI